MPGDKSREGFGSFFIEVFSAGSPSSSLMLSYCHTEIVQKRLATDPTLGNARRQSNAVKSAVQQQLLLQVAAQGNNGQLAATFKKADS
jgi:hypothetical protein